MSKQMPGPGFIRAFSLISTFNKNYLVPLERLFRDYGNHVRVPGMGSPVVFAFHPDSVEHVLKKNAANYFKADDLQELQPVLGQGLLTSEGDEWRKHRRLIAPEFSHKKLEGFFPIWQRHLQALFGQWRANKELFNAVPSITSMTFAIAGESFFGTNVDADAKFIHEAVEFTSEFAVARMSSPFRLPLWAPLPQYRRVRRAIREMDRIVFNIIDQRKESGSENPDVLSRLTKSGELNRAQIRDEVMTLLLAGHETTSNALAWTLYLLGRHPEIQEQLRDEVQKVVGGEMPELNELRSLPFTKMVLEESMRLYPPAAVVGRKTIAADQIGGFEVEAGINVQLAQWITHRHPDFWEAPLAFRPLRFADPSKHHPFAYFPFAAGPRECIGKNMAMLEAMLILAGLVKNFRWQLMSEHVGIKTLITIRPDPGVLLKLTPLKSPQPRAEPPAISH